MPSLVRACLLALLRLIATVPDAFIPPVAVTYSFFSRLFAGRALRQMRANVQVILGLPPRTHFANLFEKQVLRHQATCILETIKGIKSPAAIAIEGFSELQANIQSAEAAGRGHIMITGHIGSWELCAYYGQKASTRPFHVLAKPPRQEGVKLALEAWRAQMGAKLLWTGRASLIRDMLQALKHGASLGFVMDQKPEGRVGPVVPFFNRPTEFVSGPAAMARRQDCPVIAIFCVRTGPGRYRLISRTVLGAEHGLKDEVILTAKFAAAIEDVIRTYPEQWTWTYKRWRSIRGEDRRAQ